MLEIQGVSKKFATEGSELRAVDQVDLVVPQGAFFTLLGPSGCGKTTTLRCIAGLEFPDEGDISIGGTLVYSSTRGVALFPEEREVGMVFQSYAIWPHMTVFENVAFPLKVSRRRLARREVKGRVEWALSLVRLEGLEDRPSTRLSGGQQQRVALARALVGQPKLLLLDEPLSNLDAKLREEMRQELRQLQQSLNLTTIYVTHDQTEALAMSDKIAILRNGKIIQLGSPKEIYEKPLDPFTLSFVGSTNLLPGVISSIEPNGFCTVETRGGAIQCLAPASASEKSQVLVSIRPEDIRLQLRPPDDTNSQKPWVGEVKQLVYLGEYILCEIVVSEDLCLKVKVHPEQELQMAQKVYVSFNERRSLAIKAE